MIRKQGASALLAAIALQASLAHGLGLGDITLQSALDQPLSAEIRLRGVGDLDPSQILVGLGSARDFERAGVDRTYQLTEIQFEVELTGGGDGVVRLSTDQPIHEPYLDFVVEVRWPSGRVLREYTVLMDLPTYTKAAPEPVRPARSRAWDESGSARAAPPRQDISGGEYTVAPGDTLWSIANRSRPAGVSPQQMMASIQRNNPDAFIGGDINRLRSGRVLRLPQGSDLVALSQTQPRATTPAPAGEAQAGAPAPETPAAPAPQPAPTSGPAGTQEEGYLAIAGESAAKPADEAAGGTGQGGGSVASSDVVAQLSEAQESLSASERANAELQARVAALEEQVQNFQKLAELKNDAASTAQQAAAQPEAAAPEAAKPGASQPGAADTGLLDRVLNSTVTLVLAAGVLLLGMLAFLFRRRRSAEEFVPVDGRPARPAEPVLAPETPVAIAPALREDTPRAADIAAAAAAAVAAKPAEAATAPEPTDPVSEAEIYLAYGRQERAIEILREALSQDPAAVDARLKLMEIHAERGEQDEFLRQYGALGSDAEARHAANDVLQHAGHADWLTGTTAAAPQPPESGQDAILARTEQAIARAAAELDLGEFELDLEHDLAADLDLPEPRRGEDESEDLPELDLPYGELELDAAPAASLDAALPSGAEAVDADLDFLKGADESETKLELARAYVDMGDLEGARDILEEVAQEGSEQQREQAAALLERIRA